MKTSYEMKFPEEFRDMDRPDTEQMAGWDSVPLTYKSTEYDSTETLPDP